MRKRKYSDDDAIQAISSSLSTAQALIKLGLSPTGGNYRSMNRLIKRLNLDTSHMLGQAIHRGKVFGSKRPIESYLSNERFIASHALKLRLIREGFFEHKCYLCQNKEWLGKPIPIELEHKDGNHSNNNLDNLTILCPNCHAQTPFYCGKNIRNKHTKKVKFNKTELPTIRLCGCGSPIRNRSKTCVKCYSLKLRKVNRPTKEELEKIIWELPTSKLAKKFGVSDKAIEKWCRIYNINKPGRGYWTKVDKCP